MDEHPACPDEPSSVTSALLEHGHAELPGAPLATGMQATTHGPRFSSASWPSQNDGAEQPKRLSTESLATAGEECPSSSLNCDPQTTSSFQSCDSYMTTASMSFARQNSTEIQERKPRVSMVPEEAGSVVQTFVSEMVNLARPQLELEGQSRRSLRQRGSADDSCRSVSRQTVRFDGNQEVNLVMLPTGVSKGSFQIEDPDHDDHITPGTRSTRLMNGARQTINLLLDLEGSRCTRCTPAQMQFTVVSGGVLVTALILMFVFWTSYALTSPTEPCMLKFCPLVNSADHRKCKTAFECSICREKTGQVLAPNNNCNWTCEPRRGGCLPKKYEKALAVDLCKSVPPACKICGNGDVLHEDGLGAFCGPDCTILDCIDVKVRGARSCDEDVVKCNVCIDGREPDRDLSGAYCGLNCSGTLPHCVSAPALRNAHDCMGVKCKRCARGYNTIRLGLGCFACTDAQKKNGCLECENATWCETCEPSRQNVNGDCLTTSTTTTTTTTTTTMTVPIPPKSAGLWTDGDDS